MFTKDFLKDALERVLATFAESLVALIPTTTVAFSEVNWGIVLAGASFTAFLTVLKCVAASTTGKKGTASFS